MGWIHYLKEQRGAVRVPACGATYPMCVLDKVSSVDCARCKRTKVFKAALKLAESTSNPPGEVDAKQT
jgi:hypothetical protein